MNKLNRNELYEKFERIHANGIKRHPRTWFIANQKAVDAALITLDPSTLENKVVLSLVVLRVLDAVGSP
jgi:hypothetical protein